MATELDVNENLSNLLAKKASLEDKKDANEVDVDENLSNLLAKKASLEDKKEESQVALISDKKPDIKKSIIKKKEIPPPASNIKEEVKVEEEKPKLNWTSLIAENKYITTKKESKKDAHSFCTLVDEPLTQSQNISLGICMENLFYDTILKNTNMKDMSGRGEGKQKKGEKQKDHIWLDVEKREIIYAEQKNNINLDTEKSVSTETKVAEVAKKYPDYKITPLILAARYLSSTEPIAKKMIKTKYMNIRIVGINDYLELFGLSGFANYDEYKAVIKEVVQKKFKD